MAGKEMLNGWGHDLVLDLRHSLRRLAKTPGFAAVVVVTLALGIGATTTLFSVVHGVLLQALPYPEPDRIVRVFEVGHDGQRSSAMADPNFTDITERNRSFEALAQYQSGVVSVSGGSEPARVLAAQVSRDFFRVFSVRPLVGRAFAPDELRPGAAPAAVVSHGFWQRYLGAERELADRTLHHGDSVVSVVGVMPPQMDFPPGTDVWIPSELEPPSPSRTALNRKVVGRLDDGVSLERARRDLGAVARELEARYGDDTWMADVAVVPLHEELVGPIRPALLLLLGASGLLLLIAFANVVNLLVARAAARRGELAVRIALGAGRGRLLRLALAETLLLTVPGGLLGLLAARWGVGLLMRLEGGDLPRSSEVGVDGVVLLFAVSLSVAVAATLAVLIAWRATRCGVREDLAVGRRSQAGGGRLRGALVVVQVALTLVLLIGSGLLLRSIQHLSAVDSGFRTAGALVVNGYLPPPESPTQEDQQRRFHQGLLERLRELPEVVAVGAVDALPLSGRGSNGTFLRLQHPDEVTDWESFKAVMELPGRSGNAEYRRATPGYFRAMGIPLLLGRKFEDRDRPETVHVAVISESLAKAMWPGENPLGQWVQFGNMDGDLRALSIVGVVGDVRSAGLEAPPQPTFYAHAHQRRGGLSGALDVVVVPRRSLAERGAVAGLATRVRRVVQEADPQVAPELRTLREIYAGSTAARRFQLLLLGLFAASALLLALVGVYSVVAFHVASRRRDIGIRMALGATGSTVVGSVLRRGLLLAGVGVALGLAVALAAVRLMQSLVFGVAPTDPMTFVSGSALLLLAAALAGLLPALRAARIDPLVALRSE